MLHHSSDIDDPYSELDLRQLHGLLHIWITGICRASHWRCGNLVLRFVTATLTILSMYWICVGFKVFSASDSHEPAIHRNGACPPLRSRIALRWSISISLLDLLDGGH